MMIKHHTGAVLVVVVAAGDHSNIVGYKVAYSRKDKPPDSWLPRAVKVQALLLVL